MGTCYTYLLYDGWDWGIPPHKVKERTIEELKQEYPYADVQAQWPEYIVVDLDKISPYGDRIQNLQKYCDSAYYYPDNASYDIQKVKFKPLPPDPNQPNIRNEVHIAKAYEDWKERYDATLSPSRV